MAFERITPQDTSGKGNVGLPDTPGLSTEAMQRKLDELSLDVIIPKYNALVEALEAETGAANIGAVGGTIQTLLDALEEGKATVEALLALTGRVEEVETGKADTGDVSALEQRVTAAETEKADKTEVLRKGSGEEYSPAGPYDPATRKYVDETVIKIGAGDMQRAVYDPDGDGVVDNASALGGVPASGYATVSQTQGVQAAADAAALAAEAAQATADQGVSDAAAAQSTADEATTNLSGHTGNTSNPHSVTKSQVGLSKVNNNAISMSLSGTTLTISYS